jgi:hypothetical protein
VLSGEQQCRSLTPEFRLERRDIPVQLGFELGIGGLVQQLDRDLEVVGARQQAAPGVELGAERIGLAKDLLRSALVIPEAGLERQRVELGDAFGLGVEVKGAPRSTGSVRPGRGRRRCPPSSEPGDPGAGSAAAR